MASTNQEPASTSNGIDSLTSTYEKLIVAEPLNSDCDNSSRSVSIGESTNLSASPVNGQLSPQQDNITIPDLNLNVKEDDVKKAFADHAKDILSVSLQVDGHDRKLQSATIKMRDPAVAQLAIQDLAPLFLGKRLCFPVIGAKAAHDSRFRFGTGDLFIRNVSPSVKIEDLYELFSPVGELAGCVIPTYEDGTPRGFAYVSYSDRTLSDTAIAKINGTVLGGREIYVCHHLEKSPRNYSNDFNAGSFTNVFCRGLAPSITEQDVVELFSTIGPLRSFSLPLNEAGESKGFAFINFKDHDSAQNALTKLNGYRFKGIDLSVTRAHNRELSGKPQHTARFMQGGYDHRLEYNGKYQHTHKPAASALPTNIYIKGLSSDVTDVMLKDKFEQFGPVVSTRIMSNPEGLSRGFGFVHYQTSAAATNAIKATNDTECWGTRIYVAPAQRRDKRTNGTRSHNYRDLSGYYPPGMQGAMGQPPYMYLGMMMPNQAPFYGVYYNQDMQNPSDSSQQNPYSANSNSNQYMMQPWQMSWKQYNDYYLQMIGQKATQYRQMGQATANGASPYIEHETKTANKSWIDLSNERRVKRQGDYAPSLAAAVASAESPEAEHQAIREALYHSIVRDPAVGSPARAAQITDLMIETDKTELMHLIDNEDVLRVRILQYIEALDSGRVSASSDLGSSSN